MAIPTLLFYFEKHNYLTLSFHDDWKDAFLHDNRFKINAFNLREKRWVSILPFIRRYPLIIFLHSTNANNISWDDSPISSLLQSVLRFRKGKILFFISYECKLVPERIKLINSIGVDYIASQLPQEIAEWLYQDCRKSKIISVPHALNPKVFRPLIPSHQRPIDFGARADEYPWYLGDRERQEIFEFFLNNPTMKKKLRIDISCSAEKRFQREGWANFLNSCKGTVSTEAGTSFLERDDRSRKEVNAYIKEKPSATFKEVYDRFFSNYDSPVPGKCVTSRHFDAIGTKTCQIMFPGRFNDILKADEHYIALNRDFNNINDVLKRFLDNSYRQKMVDRTYEYAMDCHTHRHRINDLLSQL